MEPKFKKQKNRGMTFLELTVVISIFAIASSVAIFNYKNFQAKVDIQNLANDIASRFTLAQRRALFGDLHPQGGEDWRPAYGLSFDLTQTGDTDNQTFYYFADLDQEKDFDSQLYDCALYGTTECLEKVSITKGNYISRIQVYYEGNPNPDQITSSLNIVYTRPNAGAVLTSPEILEPPVEPISHAEIEIASPNSSFVSLVKIYVSGRFQIN